MSEKPQIEGYEIIIRRHALFPPSSDRGSVKSVRQEIYKRRFDSKPDINMLVDTIDSVLSQNRSKTNDA